MVSVVPSIIPILTANADAANQVKRKNKSLNNDEKKLKNSPLNDKINCRVFLNNGKVIEGHYEGNWYEDNSDEEGIWIKTDNGIEEINSKDYDRVEYYHKKTVNEAYIKAEKGNIYYTKNSDMFLSMVKSIFISKNIPVRVYYDTIKQMYVFGNAFDYIHADLATGMKYYSKIYGIDEMRANVSYLRQNCALFQVLPDDDFKKYDMGDGYSKGWFLKLDDLIFACRNKEYEKVRDNVPLFKDHIGEWIPTDYYIAKKQGLTESIKPMHINSSVKLITTDAECANWIKNNPNNRLLYDVDKKWYIVSNDIEDDIHIYMIEDAIRDGYYPEFAEKYKDRLNHDMMGEVGIEIINKNQDRFLLLRGLTKDNEELMTDGYQDKYDCGDFYMFSIKNEFEKIPVYKYFKSKLIESKDLNESVEDKILYIIRGVPGSGKSTLAHKLTDNVVEADQYFYDDKGNYNWSADKLNQAHNWCFYTVKKYMEEGRDKIAVANTFVKNKDYKRYVELAKEFGYKVDIRTCTGNYQNIHNVPDETVEKMRNKFQETPLDESVKLKNKYVFPEPDWGNLSELIDPNDRYRYWVDGVQAKIEKPYKENIPVNKIRQDYDGEDIYDYDYDYDQFDNGIDTPIEVLKYRDQYILMDGNHRAAYAKEKGLKTILAYVWDADKLEHLDESAENDKTLRDYAVKLANICLDALVKTKYETKISNKQIQINVDKAFKKAVPMLKNSPYEYFIILASKNDEPNASFGKTDDRKYGLITLPVFSKDPIDQTLSILYKHKSMLNKLYSTYSGDELKLKINEYAIKYLKKELEKSLSNVKSEYIDILIHECTHLLDDVRRTKTYKSKEQNLKDDKGIKDYFNSPEEQNAFYQETVSIFDEWANQSVGYKTFDIFWDDFIRQYRGEYNMLNDKNKRKLKKRAYAYWYVYMKD